MDKREGQIKDFLAKAGWGHAQVKSIPGDASTRRYARIKLNETRAILMDAPKDEELPSEPEGATLEQRKALGYNALARLAGPNIEAFACIADALTSRGFSAPHILAADYEAGFLLLEDMGRAVYANVIKDDPNKEAPLYEAAVKTLAAIYRASFPQVMTTRGASWRVRDYDTPALLAETDLCYDWYAKDFGRDISKEAREDIYALFTQSFNALKAHSSGLALRDFHAENLFWLKGREAVARVGLIDFQDALFVHPAYDLMSLITDIRRDVAPELKDHLIGVFCKAAGLKNDDDFRAAYAVLSVQRGVKLLGFPVRADLKFGKPQYRALLPRVKRHLQDDLSHPINAPIKGWLARNIPEALQ